MTARLSLRFLDFATPIIFDIDTFIHHFADFRCRRCQLHADYRFFFDNSAIAAAAALSSIFAMLLLFFSFFPLISFFD